MNYPSWLLFTGCRSSSEFLLSSPQDVNHQFGLGCVSHLAHTNSSLLILSRWYVNWKVLHLYVVKVHYSCPFTIMDQKYLLTASAFYSWLLIVSSPSTNYPASSLMTHLIYLRNATGKESKMFPLVLESSSWRSATEHTFSVSEKNPKQKKSNKTKRNLLWCR